MLHLFNQPLRIVKPYEGYMGSLCLPQEVVNTATARSILITYRTPRHLLVQAIEATYPGIKRANIHVWTLGGKSRAARIGKLWEEWTREGVHIVEDGWILPTGIPAFTESGTYAPTYCVGTWKDDNTDTHLFICDGYSASAEAIQAASLAPMLGLEAFMNVFTSGFSLPYEQERYIMSLSPDEPDFARHLGRVLGREAAATEVEHYRHMIHEGLDAGIPVKKPGLQIDDFFPEKKWDLMAVSGYMKPDPYSGAPGLEEIRPGVYRVTVRLAAPGGDKRLTFTLRLMETLEQSRLVFNPLLNRFMGGEDFANRPVKISDSGRIRNEIQTICSEALDFLPDERIRIHFDRIPTEVIPADRQRKLLEILRWYKEHHPLWFSWLEIAE